MTPKPYARVMFACTAVAAALALAATVAWSQYQVNPRVNNRVGGELYGGDGQPVRYTLEGEESQEEWWEFQLDGYGTWLWALNQHQKQNPEWQLSKGLLEASELVADYLTELWSLPCYDCWEEFPDPS